MEGGDGGCEQNVRVSLEWPEEADNTVDETWIGHDRFGRSTVG